MQAVTETRPARSPSTWRPGRSPAAGVEATFAIDDFTRWRLLNGPRRHRPDPVPRAGDNRLRSRRPAWRPAITTSRPPRRRERLTAATRARAVDRPTTDHRDSAPAAEHAARQPKAPNRIRRRQHGQLRDWRLRYWRLRLAVTPTATGRIRRDDPAMRPGEPSDTGTPRPARRRGAAATAAAASTRPRSRTAAR